MDEYEMFKTQISKFENTDTLLHHQTQMKMLNIYIYIYIYIYTEFPGRDVPDFGIMFLKLKYTDLTKNTYIRSSTVTEIMAREKCGLLAGPRTVPVS